MKCLVSQKLKLKSKKYALQSADELLAERMYFLLFNFDF
jgi:hypothetical protein